MPEEMIAGCRAVLTGAASGIGRATALEFARRGARLTLTDIDADGLADTATRCRELGGVVELVRALDVSDHESVIAFAQEVHVTGPVDIVCNIAGVSAWGTVENLEHRHWRRMVDINLMGPIHIVESFVPPMVAAGRGGHVVNVASAAALLALPWHAAYSASKFGVLGMSEVLKFDLARHGIGVSVVCPGAVATPLVGTVDIAGVDREDPTVRKLTARFTRHAVTPEKVAVRLLRGIERNKFIVYTSADIWAAYWLKRKCAPAYSIIMRVLNRILSNALTDYQRRTR